MMPDLLHGKELSSFKDLQVFGSDFTHVTPNLLDKMMKKLNTRPRKTLGFIAPSEFFLGSK